MSQNITNTASITYNGNPLPPTCPVVTTIEPKLEVLKAAVTNGGTYTDDNPQNEMGNGDTIRYQIQLINYSSVEFTNVVLNDEIILPNGVTKDQLTFLAPPQSSYNNEEALPKIKFTLPNVPAQSTLEIFYTIKLSEAVPTGSIFKNKANVNYAENTGSTPIESNVVGVTYTATSTTVTATKTGPENVFCDEEFDYVLTFKNTGSKVAGNVTITDNLPSEFVLSKVTVVNDQKTLVENVDYTYNTDQSTNVLTIESIGDGLNIKPQTSLVVTITGSVPCVE